MVQDSGALQALKRGPADQPQALRMAQGPALRPDSRSHLPGDQLHAHYYQIPGQTPNRIQNGVHIQTTPQKDQAWPNS